MPKPDLGVKRICPETGKKFYDLGKDPVVSPFTGKEYPVSYFAEIVVKAVRKAPKAKADPEKEEDELEDDEELETADKSADSEDEDEDAEDDAPELDEEPIDLGDDDDEEDDVVPVKGKKAPVDEDLEGFSDEEAGILLDDDEDDAFDADIDLDDADEDKP